MTILKNQMDEVALTSGYYEFLSTIYDKATAEGAWVPNSFFEEELRTLTSKALTALDLGCGTGQTLDVIARHFPSSRLLGVDIAPGMTRIAQEKLPHAELYTGDLRTFLEGQSNSFDLITSIGSLEFVPSLPDLVREVGKRLNKNGVFIFTYEPLIAGFPSQSDRHERTTVQIPNGQLSFVTLRWTPGEVAASLADWGHIYSSKLFVAYHRGPDAVIYNLLAVETIETD